MQTHSAYGLDAMQRSQTFQQPQPVTLLQARPGRLIRQPVVCRAAVKADKQARTENVGLERSNAIFVDHTCIDCDTCRWMDPQTYDRVGSMSAVVSQPDTPEARRKALQALLACPTHSIQVKQQESGEMAAAQRGFPLPTACDNVYHCGFHSEASYGAASWFIRRPGGNIMMDSPRYHPGLAKRLKELGVRYMVLSHRDDVSDHAKWAEVLECERIIHRTEANSWQGTDQCEIQIEGKGPTWGLPDGGNDVELIFTPGHTAGSISLLFKPQMALFTGDHLMYSSRLDRLSIARRYNWDSVPKQLASVRALLDYDFTHIFPGHGRQWHFQSLEDRRTQIDHLLREEGAQGVL